MQDICKYYDNSFEKAIVHLFPEIGIEGRKFPAKITRM